MIKIILRKDVKRVGSAGEVLSVKDGFARNFLLPRGLAFSATDDNLKRVETDKKKLEQERTTLKKKTQQLADQINGLSCTIAVEAQDENLFGSIGADDIVKALEEEQIAIDKNSIVLDDPIKKLGIYEIGVKLDSETNAKIKVWVVKK